LPFARPFLLIFFFFSFIILATSFVNLTELDLSWNNFVALPDWCQRINLLHFHHNQLTTLPPWLAEKFHPAAEVHHNNFSSFPPWFWNHDFEETLDLSGNPLDSATTVTIAGIMKRHATLRDIK